mmetsp:Transcript_1701/g.2241  ORF Transcript_1701/g.2241 Transcript_1701/m.2241 type:complete len:107 (+) Transcript_1701:86-406(+)
MYSSESEPSASFLCRSVAEADVSADVEDNALFDQVPALAAGAVLGTAPLSVRGAATLAFWVRDAAGAFGMVDNDLSAAANDPNPSEAPVGSLSLWLAPRTGDRDGD